MWVRWKLDLCGVKLKLSDWVSLSTDQKKIFFDKECNGTEVQAYRECLISTVKDIVGRDVSTFEPDDHPPWLNLEEIHQDVLNKLSSIGETIHMNQWRALQDIQRFALVKLSRSGHEGHNFIKALVEFGIVESQENM